MYKYSHLGSQRIDHLDWDSDGLNHRAVPESVNSSYGYHFRAPVRGRALTELIIYDGIILISMGLMLIPEVGDDLPEY
jgi:hypothetical protein